MRTKLIIAGIVSLGALSLFWPSDRAFARTVTVVYVCTVNVTFTATVPDSVEQGKSFTATDISISPANSYGFTVQSSIYDLTATNTSSTTYHQNFVSTNPSPTTGHNTYMAYYPSWTLDASGPVGSSVTVTIKKSVTIVQGYGTVNCTYNKPFFSVPIVAPTPAPPSPSSSPSPSPSPSPSSSVAPPPASSGSTKSNSPSPSASVSTSPSPSPSSSATPSPSPSAVTAEPVSVVPLNVQVKDSSGKVVKGAQVTLDGSSKMTTDANGKATFSNVLTGAHAILVSYNGQKASRDIRLAAADVGKVTSISLPPVSQAQNPIVIAAVIIAIAAIAAGGTVFYIKRIRQSASNSANPAITLSGIMDGSAVPAPAATTMTTAPAIQVFEERPAATTHAPWETAQLAAAIQEYVSPGPKPLQTTPSSRVSTPAAKAQPVATPQPAPTAAPVAATSQPTPPPTPAAQPTPTPTIAPAPQAPATPPIPPAQVQPAPPPQPPQLTPVSSPPPVPVISRTRAVVQPAAPSPAPLNVGIPVAEPPQLTTHAAQTPPAVQNPPTTVAQPVPQAPAA